MPLINIYASIGLKGQLGLEGDIPFERDRDSIMRMVQKGVIICGSKSRHHFEEFPLVMGWNHIYMPDEFIDSIRKRYYDKEIWILGGEYTFHQFAQWVDGQRIFDIRPYDGPADMWFPWRSYF